MSQEKEIKTIEVSLNGITFEKWEGAELLFECLNKFKFNDKLESIKKVGLIKLLDHFRDRRDQLTTLVDGISDIFTDDLKEDIKITYK